MINKYLHIFKLELQPRNPKILQTSPRQLVNKLFFLI